MLDLNFKQAMGYLLLAALFFPAEGLSSPTTISYQGRIVTSDGRPLEYSSVSFLFQVMNMSGSCVLYEEQLDGFNMVGSKGVFDTAIGGGTRLFPTSGSASLLDVFNNTSLTGLPCKGGSNFIPSLNDVRRLRVFFHDGHGWKQITPDNVIRSVPFASFAFRAAKVGSFGPEDLVTKPEIPSCGSNTFLSWNGTQLTCEPVSGSVGGTVTGVASTNAYLTVANGSSAASLTLHVGTSANTVAAGNDVRFSDARTPMGTASGDLGDSYPNPKVVKIQGVDVNGATPSDGQFLKFTSSAWRPANLAISDIAGLSTTLNGVISQSQFPASCYANQTLTFLSPSGSFTCSDILIDGNAFAHQSAGAVLAGPTSGSAKPTFRTLQMSDLPASLTDGAWTANGANVYRGSGNVGIGTANPSAMLSIEGTSGQSATIVLNSEAIGGGVRTNVVTDTAAQSGNLVLTRARNTLASPAYVQNGDQLGTLTFRNHTNLMGSTVRSLATENHSSTVAGASLRFDTVPNGSNIALARLLIDQNGNIGIGTTTPSTKLEVVGTVKATGFEGPLTATTSSTGAGSASTPSMTFSGDTDTGFYNTASNDTVSVAAGGANIFNFNSLGLVSATAGGASVSTATGTAGAPTFSFAGDTDTGWFSPAANHLAASTGGSERIRIDANGNVGIGITAPDSTLSVSSTSSSLAGFRATPGSSTEFIGLYGYSDDDAVAYLRDTVMLYAGNNTKYLNITAASTDGNIRFHTGSWNNSANERMRVTAAGNIGIGTTNPMARLHISDGKSVNAAFITTDRQLISGEGEASGSAIVVAGDSAGHRPVFKGTRARGTLNTPTVPNADDQVLSLLGAVFDGTQIQATALVDFKVDGAVSAGTAPQRISFLTSATNGSSRVERMTIKSSGNVGIGTITPQTTLNVEGTKDYSGSTPNFSSFDFTVSAPGSAGIGIGRYNGQPSLQGMGTGTSYGLHLNPAVGNVYLAGGGGNVSIGATNPARTLDVRKNDSTVYTATSSSAVSPGDINKAGVIIVNPSNTDGAGSFIELASSESSTRTGINYLGTISKAGSHSSDFVIGSRTGLSSYAERMRIDSVGSVGIGTTTPASKLHVAGTGYTEIKVGSGGSSNSGFSLVPDSGNHFSLQASGSADALGASNFYIRDVTANAPRLLINPSGNVGIGTVTPTSKLQVNGNVEATGFSIAGVPVGTSTDSYWSATGGGAIHYSSGNIGIGTNSPGYLLDVNGMARISSHLILGSSTMGLRRYFAGGIATDLGLHTTNGDLYLSTNGTSSGEFVLKDNGYVGIGITAPSYNLHVVGDTYTSGYFRSPNGTIQTSDKRYKKNIEAIHEPLQKILSLRGVTYDWKKEEFPQHNFSAEHQLGVIAQEVEKQFPEAVVSDKEGYKSVNYSVLVAPIIEALKELYAKWSTDASEKEARIQVLEKKNQYMERKLASVEQENSSLTNEISALQQRHEILKLYLCHKDPEASFCKE